MITLTPNVSEESILEYLRDRLFDGPKLNLTGRFFVLRSPMRLMQRRLSVTLEVNDFSSAQDVYFHPAIAALRQHEIKTRLARRGFRGVRRVQGFPHPNYPLAVRLPKNFTIGCYSVTDLIMDGRPINHTEPALSEIGEEAFERLRLTDYRLANDIAPELMRENPKSPWRNYAVFRDESDWMLAKMKFG